MYVRADFEGRIGDYAAGAVDAERVVARIEQRAGADNHKILPCRKNLLCQFRHHGTAGRLNDQIGRLY